MNYKELQAVYIRNIEEQIFEAFNINKKRVFWNPTNDGTIVCMDDIVQFVHKNVKTLSNNTLVSKQKIKATILNRMDLYEVLKNILPKYLNDNYFFVLPTKENMFEISKQKFLQNEYVINYTSIYNGLIFTNNGNIILNGKFINKQRNTSLTNENIDVINSTIDTFKKSLTFHEIDLKYSNTPNDEIKALIEIINDTIEALITAQNNAKKDHGKDCCICFTEIKVKIALIPCGHTQTCESCIEKINNTCSICKQIVTGKMNIY